MLGSCCSAVPGGCEDREPSVALWLHVGDLGGAQPGSQAQAQDWRGNQQQGNASFDPLALRQPSAATHALAWLNDLCSTHPLLQSFRVAARCHFLSACSAKDAPSVREPLSGTAPPLVQGQGRGRGREERISHRPC